MKLTIQSKPSKSALSRDKPKAKFTILWRLVVLTYKNKINAMSLQLQVNASVAKRTLKITQNLKQPGKV